MPEKHGELARILFPVICKFFTDIVVDPNSHWFPVVSGSQKQNEWDRNDATAGESMHTEL